MKDTLNPTAPAIEARDLNLVFQTGDGPVHGLSYAEVTSEWRTGHFGFISVSTQPTRCRVIELGV